MRLEGVKATGQDVLLQQSNRGCCGWDQFKPAAGWKEAADRFRSCQSRDLNTSKASLNTSALHRERSLDPRVSLTRSLGAYSNTLLTIRHCYLNCILNCVSSCGLERLDNAHSALITPLLCSTALYPLQRAQSFPRPSALTFKWASLHLTIKSSSWRKLNAFPNPPRGGEVGETKCGKTAKEAPEFIRWGWERANIKIRDAGDTLRSLLPSLDKNGENMQARERAYLNSLATWE